MKVFAAAMLLWVSARAVTVETALSPGPGGGRMVVRLLHRPDIEPIAALRIRLHLHPGLSLASLALVPPDQGPWSQIAPELDRSSAKDGQGVEVLALAPNHSGLSFEGNAPIFSLELALAAPFPADQRPVDSARILEAWDADARPLNLALRDSTAALGAAAREGRPQVSWRTVDRLHTLSFYLTRPTAVRARVIDVLGHPVRTLALGLLAPGNRKVQWDGRDAAGATVAAGRYVIELRLGPLTYHKPVAHAP